MSISTVKSPKRVPRTSCTNVLRVTCAHGGKIWAENDAEGGAVFRIVLPAVPGRDDRPPS